MLPFVFGGESGIRLLPRPARLRSFAALDVHRTSIHYRSYFESLPIQSEKQKVALFRCYLLFLAESQGFEPWVSFPTQHFECCTFDHSDNSPYCHVILSNTDGFVKGIICLLFHLISPFFWLGYCYKKKIVIYCRL